MEIKTESNPVGAVAADPNVDVFVANMKQTWDEGGVTGSFWRRPNLTAVVNFLIGCLDQLVGYFIDHGIPGADKKATVLDTLEKIYDHVITSLLPIWLRPFAPLVRKFIFTVVLSAAIDWVVNKYRNGSWRPDSPAEIVAQWHTVSAQFAAR